MPNRSWCKKSAQSSAVDSAVEPGCGLLEQTTEELGPAEEPLLDPVDSAVSDLANCEGKDNQVEEAQLLQAITLAIAESSDFHTALNVALRQLCEATGWSLAEAWVPNVDRTQLECSTVWYGSTHYSLSCSSDSPLTPHSSLSEEPKATLSPSPLLAQIRQFTETLTFPPNTGLIGRVWSNRQPEWVPDVSSAPDDIFLRVQIALEIGLKAGLAIPVLAGGQVVAVLAFFMFKPHPEDKQLVSLVSAVAAQLGAVVRLKQAEVALRESQRQLAALIGSLPGIAFSCVNDGEWSTQYLSEGCLKLTGYTSEELSGTNRLTTYNAITDPEDLPEVLATIEQAIAQKQSYVAKYRIRTKSGEQKWLWERGRGVFDSDGKALSLEGFITDITDLKRTEDALRESEERFRSLITNVPGAVYRCAPDAEWTVQFISDLIEEISGYPASDFLQNCVRTFPSMIYAEDAAWVEQAIRDAIAEKQPYVLEFRIVRADGSIRWVYEQGQGVFDETGNLLCFDGVLFDITKRRQAERALQEQKDLLRLVLDNIPQYIFWKDHNSTYLGCNRIFAEAVGVGLPEAIIGLTDYDIPAYTPEEAKYFRACDRWVIDQDQPDLHVLEIQPHADGKRTWIDRNKTPIHDAEGNVIGILGTFEDITERRRSEEALRQAEEKYRSIFENAVEGIFQTSTDGRYLTANPMLARIYGYDSPEDLMSNLTDIKHQLYVDPGRRNEFKQLIQEQEAVWGFESQIYRKNGTVIWISECARTMRGENGELLGYEGTVEDITDRKQSEVELYRRDSLLQGVAEATNHLLTNVDYEAAIAEALSKVGKAAGVDRAYIYENHPHPTTGEVAMSLRFEWTQQSIESGIHKPYWQNQSYSNFGMTRWYEILASGGSVGGITKEFPSAEQEILNRDNIRSILMVPILIEDQFWGYVGFDECREERQWSRSEESILIALAASIGGAIQRKWTEEMIRYQAFHDLLTGLPNRILFSDRLLLELERSQHDNTLLAVMFLDLDRFKVINDTLGHAVGDRLLQDATQRLVSCLREGDTIARWGGDEFTLLLPQIDSLEDVSNTAQRILDAMKPAFHPDGHELYITNSIGIALYPYDGDDAQVLLKNADAALYQAKEQGRNNYRFYAPAMNSQASELLTLANRLHHALEWGEFTVYYQPQVNTTTGEVSQMEALLRWQHPELGIISPEIFISLAEANGLIVSIGEWALRTACAQNKAWQDAGLPSLRIAVNLSARQFQQPNLVERVARILQETGLEPRFLELEITETTVMGDVDFTCAMLCDLSAMGVQISMDDFGTGYSSLSYLKKFPLHTIKIDQSFVRELVTNPQDMAIVTAVATLGKGLNLRVVAEGVETQEQMQLLRSLHCEEMQGYLFSKPLPTEEAISFLQNYSKKSDKTALHQDNLAREVQVFSPNS